ncbi:MAG: protoporphyrinogen oxidase HemJ [Alphaproteobacteria bacterium]|nr:protoporphyrinogen oxidase HemJ [Alphaproteobacteria bacterium]
MTDFILSHYDWFKALHLIAVMSWMAGMLYLPRLYVYHTGADKGSELSETLKIMERKLLRIIINPAMILSWGFGLAMLAANPGLLSSGGWMHVKLGALVLMQIFHAFLSRWRKAFLKDKNHHSAAFYRKANEIPTVLMIVIVIMVIVKPF